MKYLKISNKGAVHRRRLEIFGVSIKTNSEDRESVIGQFGSGFKIATVVALRLGLEVIVASSDNNGSYILTFKKRTEVISDNNEQETVETIVYSYSDIGDKETAISLRAFSKWNVFTGESNAHYPIVREFIANAKDEDDDFKVSISDTILPAEANQTIVYIKYVPDIENIIKNINKYFKFLGYKKRLLFEVPGFGRIYGKSSEETRLFVQGRLVYVSSSISSEFDYDIEDKSMVSEDGNIKNSNAYKIQVAKLIMKMEDPRYRILLEAIFVRARDDVKSFEAIVIDKVKKDDISEEMKAILSAIWCKFYGEKSVLLSNSANNLEAEQAYGYKVISVAGSLYKLFSYAGVDTSEDIVKRFVKNMSTRPISEDEKAALSLVVDKYISHIKFFMHNLSSFPVQACVDDTKHIKGSSDYNSIDLEESIFKGNKLELLRVFLHELRHCKTKLHDTQYRSFLRTAEKELIIVMVMLQQAINKLREFDVRPAEISNLFC